MKLNVTESTVTLPEDIDGLHVCWDEVLVGGAVIVSRDELCNEIDGLFSPGPPRAGESVGAEFEEVLDS